MKRSSFTIFFLKLTFLTVSFFMPFMAKAQCDNITMTATSTPATCPGNGVITVTLDGLDIGNLDLSSVQLKITGDGGGFSTGFLTWAGAGNEKLMLTYSPEPIRLNSTHCVKILQQRRVHGMWKILQQG